MDIKARRKELGLTLADVASAVGVNDGTVSRWESGDIENMRRDKIALLAKVLEVDVVDILGISTSKNNSFEVSEHEKKVITAYRSKPEMQPVVDKLLDVPSEKDQPTQSNIARIAALDGDGMSAFKLPDSPEDIARQNEAAKKLQQNRKRPRSNN